MTLTLFTIHIRDTAKTSPWHERAPHSLANDTQVHRPQSVLEHKYDRDC